MMDSPLSRKNSAEFLACSSKDRPMIEKIEELENKQLLQEHLLKSLRQSSNSKIGHNLDRITALRESNKEQMAKVLRMAGDASRYLTGSQFYEGKPSKIYYFNCLVYDRVKKTDELDRLRKELAMYKRITKPGQWTAEIEEDAQSVVKLDNRLAEMDEKQSMARIVAEHYKEIISKFKEDIKDFPLRIKDMEDTIREQRESLEFAKRAQKVAKRDKKKSILKYRQKQKQCDEEKLLRDEDKSEVIAEIRKSRERSAAYSEQSKRRKPYDRESHMDKLDHERRLHVMALQEGFDKIRKAIPGASMDTVVTRIITQRRLNEKLKMRVDEKHQMINEIQDDIKRLQEHLQACRFGGNESLLLSEGYQRDFQERIIKEELTLKCRAEEANKRAKIITTIRSGISNILDLLHFIPKPEDKTKSKPKDILDLINLLSYKERILMAQVNEAQNEDFDKVNDPEFLEHLETEINKTDEDDISKILAKHKQQDAQPVMKKDSDHLELDKDSTLELEEFRKAMKTKSHKLYMAKCKKIKRYKRF